MEDWILFIFKRGCKHYLVPAESDVDAWEKLSSRQSISKERCQKEYKFLGYMNAYSPIWKI